MNFDNIISAIRKNIVKLSTAATYEEYQEVCEESAYTCIYWICITKRALGYAIYISDRCDEDIIELKGLLDELQQIKQKLQLICAKRNIKIKFESC